MWKDEQLKLFIFSLYIHIIMCRFPKPLLVCWMTPDSPGKFYALLYRDLVKVEEFCLPHIKYWLRLSLHYAISTTSLLDCLNAVTITFFILIILYWISCSHGNTHPMKTAVSILMTPTPPNFFSPTHIINLAASVARLFWVFLWFLPWIWYPVWKKKIYYFLYHISSMDPD